jgi:hypothetical protein
MNNLGLIAKNKKLFNEIVKRIGENNKNHIYLEILPDNSFSPEEILKKINLLNDKKVDFIAIDDLEIFDEFEFLQENSPLLILHPIDTLVKSLGRDLNQFPLWILGNKSAKRILELHGYSYQMADKQTKENFEKLKTLKDTEEIKDIIKKRNIKIQTLRNRCSYIYLSIRCSNLKENRRNRYIYNRGILH